MDAHRFDAITRILGDRQPRRRALKLLISGGLASTLATPTSTRARTVTCLPFGETCDADDVDGPPCCAGLACIDKACLEPLCVGLEEACDADTACCDPYLCVDGVCIEDLQCAEVGGDCGVAPCCDDLVCNAGVCETPAPTCVEETLPCETTADCCPNLVCNQAAFTCEPESTGGGGDPTCGQAGAPCDAKADCCDDLICLPAGACGKESPDDDDDDAGGDDDGGGDDTGNEPKPPTGGSSGGPVTLPSTGVGGASTGLAARFWLAGAGLLAAAGALATGLRRRDEPAATAPSE